MSSADQALLTRVATLRDGDADFSPAVADALRLADTYRDIQPELYSLPTSQTLGTFRPMNANVMLYRAVPAQGI